MKNINLSQNDIRHFEEQGYLIVKGLLNLQEVETYRNYYTNLLEKNKPDSQFRSDLASHVEQDGQKKELITQVMLPSKQVPDLLDLALHKRSLSIAKQLLGEDMELDFDMLIDKAPFTDAITPWHQDRAYWISMPDLRAVSCWVALDKATVDNGCMWYIPGSHLQAIRPHQSAGKGGGALCCEASEEEGLPIELEAGDCVLHHGGTVHYSRGNSTGSRRRAFINNFRPEAMIAYERERGYDHTGERKIRDESAKSTDN